MYIVKMSGKMKKRQKKSCEIRKTGYISYSFIVRLFDVVDNKVFFFGVN